jgi:hypothetical protein
MAELMDQEFLEDENDQILLLAERVEGMFEELVKLLEEGAKKQLHSRAVKAAAETKDA